MRQILAVLLAVLLLAPLLCLVAPTHAEDEAPDGDVRVGTVLSVQGRALVRPGDRRRWTPLGRDAVLLPGDSLKTGARGAHALQVQLVGDTSLLLGPDALVSLPRQGEVRVLGGDVEVRATHEDAIALSGPGGFAQQVTGTAIVRVEGTTSTLLDEEPRWLKGYRESTGNEWMGSLLANVDGRNLPLAVGYHKVTVDVRDQIARTTVEQSFVNSTDSRLEGVFYFPLPADASISGFAMWIGNELVEADVVEKARARQIYEDILRRKKDPGLLEWQGGNLFKARVFPIEPHAEKRVRLRYTQVLRLEGQTWRYRYALRSDLLRSKPLRRLDVQVNVASTRPMTKVECPSHACAIDTSAAGTEARVRFDAEDYVPTRDLEVAVTLEPSAGLSAVTHRRGDEGTFMLLLSPPSGEGAGWTRELLPEGEPLDLILVADTSGSMDAAARETQAAFVEGLLDLLGPDDRFRLLAADVSVHAAFEGPQPATEETKAAARAFLDGRVSLGWTDLDATLDRVLAEAEDGTLVVYLGDGIPTTNDADPVAQAERIRGRGAATGATVHAVATSSTYEQGVLDALASIGGGSVRRADDAPAAAAYALLDEVARPMLRNAKVEIRGIPTARVYPETLPNLPVGGQQVVLGRFLPGDAASEGQVVVTGDLAGETVRFTSTLRLPATDAGNSFLPRLWARQHLDALLAQGTAQAVKDEIVAFSAEYGILTPHTSLLVLESDEDRERYGVARTVQMRDGEAFFAAGRDKVALEMAREQSRQARAWRQGLRRRMLGEIQGLGRDLLPDRPVAGLVALGEELHANAELGAGSRWGAEGGLRGYAQGDDQLGVPVTALRKSLSLEELESAAEPVLKDEEVADHVETDNDLPFEESLGEDELSDAPFSGPAASPSGQPPPRARRALTDADDFRGDTSRFEGRGGRRTESKAAKRPTGGLRYDTLPQTVTSYAGRPENLFDVVLPGGVTPATLGFPWMADPSEPDAELGAPDWSEEIVGLLKRLDRREALSALSGGLRVARQTARVHPVRPDDVLASSSELLLVSPRRWFVRGERGGAAVDVAWVDADHRAHVDATRGLGRRRVAHARDTQEAAILLDAFSYDEFVATWRRQRLSIDDTRSRLVHLRIEAEDLDGTDRVLQIDPERRVVVGEVSERAGRVVSRVRHGGFVEVGGLWWPRLTRVFDERERMTAFVSSEVTALEAEAFDGAFEAATAVADGVLFLDGRLPDAADATQAVHESRATFADHLRLALHEAGTQRWDEALAAWRAARALAAGARGAAWIDLAFLLRARRGEALLAHTRTMADGAGEAAQVLYGQAAGGLGANERLDLLGRLEAAWRADGERAALGFDRALSAALDQAGRSAEARGVRARVAAAWPLDLEALRDHVSDLLAIGDVDAAIALLDERASSVEPQRFTLEERAALYARLTDVLWNERRLVDLDATLAAWTETAPTPEAWRRLISRRFLRSRVAEADAWVLETLAGPVPEDPLADETARMQAAVELALGNGWAFDARRVEPGFVPALVDLGRRVARSPVPSVDLLRSIVGNWRFRRTDGGRLLEDALREDALAGTVDGLRSLIVYGAYVPWSRASVDPSAFTAFTGRLAARWTRTTDGRQRDALADLLVRLFDAHGDRDEALTVLRNRLASEQGHRRAQTAAQLFDRLLGIDEPRVQAREDGAFALLPDLLDPYDPAGHDAVAATASRRLAAWSFAARRKDLLGDPAARPGQTRAEAREAAREAAAGARRGLVARLRAARAQAPVPFLRWLALEQLGYAVELGEGLPAILASATELLDGVAKTSDDPLDVVLAERCVLVLDYLTLRRNAPEGAAELVLALLADRAADPLDERLDWRFETFRLLLALDRSAALESRLRTWLEPSRVRSLWRVALGYVLAEQGRLDEAARLLEQVAATDELSADAWGVLAAWHLARGDDAARERALDGQDAARSENELSSLVWQARARLNARGAGGIPDDFDPETLRHIRWLLRKSSRPENHVWALQALYENVRDHRLLESLAEGLPGHTPEGLYGFLRRAGQLTAKVFEEATVDAAVERIQVLTEAAATPHDRRGLLLLQVLFDTRAALVAKADPSHAARAVAALASLREGKWAIGERAEVAEVIAATAPVAHPALAAARLALLRELLDQEAADSPWRLGLADALARVLWAQGEQAPAIDALTIALAAARDGDGRLPQGAWASFDRLVGWTAEVGHFRDAERLLEGERALAAYASRRDALVGNLLGLYAQAAAKDGTLSFGRGEALVAEATLRMDARLAEGPPSRAHQTAWYVVTLYEGARQSRALPDAPARFERWARDRLPAHFERLLLESTQLAQVAADGCRRLAGPREALSYALDHMDGEPAWFERIGRDYWSSDHYDLSRWRKDAAPIGELGTRLLPRVLASLRQYLQGGDRTGQSFWQPSGGRYWALHADAYAATSSAELELQPGDVALQKRAASYLRDLGRRAQAVEALKAARARGDLDPDGTKTLADWMVRDERFAEALVVLEPLLETRADDLDLYVLRAQALHGVDRTDEAVDALRRAEDRWRERKRWTDQVAARLGATALELERAAPAETWLDAAVALRTESHGGGADNRLGQYFGLLAEARVLLGKTDAAVDAASAGVVAWGRNARQRSRALVALETVFERAPDLAAYVERYEAQVAETGLDAPVIRKGLAAVFTKRARHADAVHHLLAAREIAPEDAEIHQRLVAAYDALGRPAEAVEALLASLAQAPRNLEAAADLAGRHAEAGREAEAERARTNLVEPLPHESDGHRRLAALREQEADLDAALVQWQQVVRTDPLDPTGWLATARCQIRSGRKDEARATLEHVQGTAWEERFGDVHAQAAALRRELE